MFEHAESEAEKTEVFLLWTKPFCLSKLPVLRTHNRESHQMIENRQVFMLALIGVSPEGFCLANLGKFSSRELLLKSLF